MSSPPHIRPLLGGTRRRLWADPRFFIGAALVIVSIVGVWFVVQTATRQTAVYSAARTLVVGQQITASDLVLREVRLGDGEERYLQDGALPETAFVVTRTVGEGELVPQTAIGTAEEVAVSSLVIDSGSSLAQTVQPGARVDIWSAPRDQGGEIGPPSVVVSGASVVRVVDDQKLVSDGGAVVEVRVPQGEVAAVLAAISRDDVISIVSVPGS